MVGKLYAERGSISMFKSLMNMLSISLQGTLFSSKPKKKAPSTYDLLMYSMDMVDREPPYVLVAEEFKIKHDLISKLHSVDNRLQATRSESRKGRARWCPDVYEQNYGGPKPIALDPQIEVYSRALGLSRTREIYYGE